MSIPFAIRDDDLSYWTGPETIAEVYGFAIDAGALISFAAIPFSVRSVSPGNRALFHQILEPTPIAENRRLVQFVSELSSRGQAELMLHGFDHSYAVATPQSTTPVIAEGHRLEEIRRLNPSQKLKWIGECVWKPFARLAVEIPLGRRHLETTFKTQIRVFVPPSNQIGANAARILDNERLHLSGIPGRLPDRPLSLSYLKAYAIRCWGWCSGHTPAFPLRVGSHRELVAYALTPTASPGALRSALYHCVRVGAPFVLATHHWELADNSSLQQELNSLVEEARSLRCAFVPVTECFR